MAVSAFGAVVWFDFMRAWRVPLLWQDLKAHALAATGRNFLPAEWRLYQPDRRGAPTFDLPAGAIRLFKE